MELDWEESEGYRGRTVYEAEYEAYDTPMGPAIATAKVYPDGCFPDTAKYETWIEDPFLKELDCRYYEKFSYGTQIEHGYEESAAAAIEVCETSGYRNATESPFYMRGSGGALWNVPAVKAAAEWYIYEQGAEPLEILGVEKINGQYETDVQVLLGGYEHSRWVIYMDEDFNFDVYVK